MKYSIENKILKVTDANGNVHCQNFEWPIDKILEINGILIVLIMPESTATYNQNVFGVSQNGELLWQIETQKTPYENSPYTGLNLKDGKLSLYNWGGFLLFVEPGTGKVLNRVFTK